MQPPASIPCLPEVDNPRMHKEELPYIKNLQNSTDKKEESNVNGQSYNDSRSVDASVFGHMHKSNVFRHLSANFRPLFNLLEIDKVGKKPGQDRACKSKEQNDLRQQNKGQAEGNQSKQCRPLVQLTVQKPKGWKEKGTPVPADYGTVCADPPEFLQITVLIGPDIGLL